MAGGSGSGKTTIAGQLAARRGLPVHHLDEIALAPADGRLRALEERVAAVHAIAAGDEWVVEGIYTGWTAELYDRAEVIVWLDSVSCPDRGLAGDRPIRLERPGRDAPARPARADPAARAAPPPDRPWPLDPRDPGLLRRPGQPGLRAAWMRIEPPPLEPGDESLTGREATAAILSPLRAKVVHCRSAGDVRRMLEQLG